MLGTGKRKNNNLSDDTKQEALVLPLNAHNRSLAFLVQLIDEIRPDNPKKIEQAELKFKAVLYKLTQDRSALFSFRKALLTQFLKTNIVFALAESGIVSSRGFIQELIGKLKHKFLPELMGEDNFLYVIDKVFYKKTDYIWVSGIDKNLWIQFFEVLGIQINLTEQKLINQFNQALQFLSYRITTLGLEKEITQRFGDYENTVYPFLEQNRLVNEYLHADENKISGDKKQLILYNISEALHNCNQSIQWIKEQRSIYGTSLAQAYIITRLQQQIDRLFIIVDVLDRDNVFNTERFVEYFQTVVQNENRKNSVREFLSENTGYLAYQIAEHGGRKGERFITTTKKEFWKMFLSACGGGFIISFIAIIKNLLNRVVVNPFWQGILLSTNYSIGFILIQDTGATLATKQPAYTANNVASSLDTNKLGDRPDLRNLAITIAKVSRTQLASFTGNLLLVFPMSYFLADLLFQATGSKIVEGEAAHALLVAQQPFHSLALLYACFTGFFLFASGLIAGFVENYVVFGKIPDRIKTMEKFNRNFGEKTRYRILHYIENNLGALVGSISLGFFLGMAGFVGKTLGIPFDIRHITISAANASIGFWGLEHMISIKELLYTIFGVLSIGFLNFVVSFGLAFIVAIKSRGIHLREYPEFLGIIWRYFKKYPRDFIKAPSSRKVEQLD